MTLQKPDPDLLSLETSLAAIDDDLKHERKYGPHPAGVYYYLCFLGLIFILMILAIMNTVRVPESHLISMYTTKSSRIDQSKISSTENSPSDIGAEKRPSTPSGSDPWNYSTFSPEQLQKIANQLQSNPSAEFNAIRAEVFSFLGLYGEQPKLKKDAQNYASSVYKINSSDARANRAMALSFLVSDQPDKAKTYLAASDGKLADSLSDWVGAYAILKGGNHAFAIGKMEQIRKKDPMFYPASFVLIQEYMQQNQLSQAREIIEFWRSKSVSDLAFVHFATDLLDRQQQYVELLYYLNSFEKLYPKDWMTLFYLGKGNLKLQKKDLAKSYFQKILDSQENYQVDQIGKTFFETGKMYMFDNDYKSSIRDLFQASQRIPADQNIKFYLASAYFKNDDYENAIEIYKQMLSRDQYDPKIRIYLGMCYFEAGQYKLAEKNLMQVYNQGYDEPLLLYYLAKVEDQKGNTPSAIKYLETAVTADPKNAPARKMLERLKTQPVPAPGNATQ